MVKSEDIDLNEEIKRSKRHERIIGYVLAFTTGSLIFALQLRGMEPTDWWLPIVFTSALVATVEGRVAGYPWMLP